MTIAVNTQIAGSYLQASTDSSGNMTGIVGPDGLRRLIKPGRRAVVIGDSIAYNNFPTVAGATGYDSRGVFIHANAELAWPWDIVANGGVSGERSDQILARVPALLLANDPDWVLIPGGFINDVVADRTAAQITANLSQILALCSGRNILWTTALPTSLNAGTAARKLVLHAVNRWLTDQQLVVPGLFIVDTYSTFVDVTNGNHASTFSSDNLHPNTLGAASVSRAVVSAMQKTYGALPSPKWGVGVDNYKNMAFNSYGVGSNADGAGGFTAGGLTGVGPNGWEGALKGTGAGVGSKIASTDEVQGEWSRIAVTATALQDGAGWVYRFRTSTTWAATTAYALGARRVPTVSNGFIYRAVVAGTSGGSQPTWPTTPGQTVVDGTVTWACFDMPAVGDTVEASVEFAMSSWSAGAMAYAYVECLDAGSVSLIRSHCLFPNSGDALPSRVVPSGVLVIPEFTVPASTVNVNLQIRGIGAAGATGNIDIRRVYASLTNR